MNFPDTMACVSIRQPWASLIAAGYKDVENRGWSCAYHGPLLIHAGKTWGDDEQAAYDKLMTIAIEKGDARRQDVLFFSRSLLGGLVGVCRMVGCVHEKQWYREGGKPFDGWREWFVGPYGWQLREAEPFPRLIPYKGQQGLFRVPVAAIQDADCREVLRYVV